MEDFVPFELAKKLNEKGFTCEYPFAMYDEDGEFYPLYSSDKYYYGMEDFNSRDFIAPTISQVLKRLREDEDDPNTGIISHLMVYSEHRKNRIGHKTLFDAEQFLKHKGVNTILLMCENGSWVFNWYIREGYSFHSNEDHKYVWLVKTK